MQDATVSSHHRTASQRHPAILFTMCLGVLIAQLDSTVVYLAVKHIGGDLDIGITAMQWVLDIYNLFYASFLLTGGTLGDLFGRMRLFVIGIGLIGIGSLICAVAPDGGVLIAGRAVTGLGSALELPASLAILSVTYSDADARGRAIGIWASCNGLAMALGPSIGGLLVDTAGWRSIFYVVIPVCALAIALAMRRVPESKDPEGRHLDPLGQGLAILALGALAYVVIEGPHRGLASAAVLPPAIVAVLAGLAFLKVESGRPGAMMPLDLFRNATFNAALAIAGLMTFGMYAMMFLMPIYLQAIGGLTAFMAGLALVPMSATFTVVSQASGALTKQVGARAMMTAGMAMMGAGLLLLTFVGVQTNVWMVETALVVIGVGLGLNTGPVNAVVVANAPPERVGTASGLINTTRMVGATMGIAVLGAVYAVFARDAGPEGIVTGLRLAFAGGAAAELSGAVLAFAFTRKGSTQRQAAPNPVR